LPLVSSTSAGVMQESLSEESLPMAAHHSIGLGALCGGMTVLSSPMSLVSFGANQGHQAVRS